MTREQRNQAKGRLEDLALRLSALDGILATQLSSPFYRTECDKIREEIAKAKPASAQDEEVDTIE